MISGKRWTPWVLVGLWPAAMAVLAFVSCVGQEPTGLCTAGADSGETGRLLCPDPGDPGGLPLCVDPSNDSRNCGACGTVCASFQLCSAGTCAYPTSCADAQQNFGQVDDGSYLIHPIARKPFIVYCAGMSTASPKDYLSLVYTHGNGDANENFSAYYCSNCTDNAYTYFEKVRLDPATLLVTSTDTTFATFGTKDMTCWDTIGGGCGNARDLLSYATAGNCILNGVATPGNVDLRGTTFSIDPSVSLVLNGDDPYGMNSFNSDRTQLYFSAGGDCGGYGPANGVFRLKQD